MKTALITGITGQDGSYLAELLLAKGYTVHGLVRRTSSVKRERIDALTEDSQYKDRFFLHYGDLSDAGNIRSVIVKVQPDEIYNLGAQSHVQVSFEVPQYTADVTGLGVLRILEAMRDIKTQTGKNIKLYQAGTSEMFGSTPPPQSEKTPFHPRSPYGCAKLFAHHAVINYREAHGIFASNGILFNHESERRGENFVTRKITIGIARILAGKEKAIHLGNLESKRDWGYAPEYVEVMWKILQQPKPGDYVIGTGETHTIREFLNVAFRAVGITDWKPYVEIDPRHYRPSEVDVLVADASKAKRELGWAPKTTFPELVKKMLRHDLATYGLEGKLRDLNH